MGLFVYFRTLQKSTFVAPTKVDIFPANCRQRLPPHAHISLALIKGFPYYGYMNVTLSLDDDLVREVRKIAVERDTTLTGLVRGYLQEVAAEHTKSGRKRREIEALRKSFERLKFNVGKRTWKRADLHERR